MSPQILNKKKISDLFTAEKSQAWIGNQTRVFWPLNSKSNIPAFYERLVHELTDQLEDVVTYKNFLSIDQVLFHEFLELDHEYTNKIYCMKVTRCTRVEKVKTDKSWIRVVSGLKEFQQSLIGAN